MTFPTTFNKSLGWLFSLLVPLGFGFYAIKLGQDANWDLLNYHLYNAYAYLNNRLSIDLAPAGLQTYFNPFLDVAYFTALTYLSPKMVGFLLGFIQGLNFILVYKISTHVLREHKLSNIYSLLLALAGLLSVGFLSEVGTMFNDSLIAIFPLLSLYLIVSSINSSNDNQQPTFILILCSGVLAGIGCGLKLTTSIYALSMCISFFVLPIQWNRRFKLAFLFGISVLIGFLASGGHWMYEIWNLFGNPLFPQFNNLFHGDLAKFGPVRDIRFLPTSIFEKIFYPVIFTANPFRVSELKFVQVSWLLIYISVLILLASRVMSLFKISTKWSRPLTPEVSYLVAFFCLSYLLWLNIFGIYRYLVSIEILIPLLLFLIITHFFKSRLSSWGAILFVVIITVLNLRGVPDWGHSAWSEDIYHFEPSMLSAPQEPVAVYLVGQPIAWIIPALNIKAPFIHIAPNFPVSAAYWQRAKMLVKGREGKSFLVLQSYTPDMVKRAQAGLAKLNLALTDDPCRPLVGRFGASSAGYAYCEVK